MKVNEYPMNEGDAIMKKSMKMLSLILAGTMVMSMAGCSGKAEETTPAQTEATTAAAGAETTAAEAKTTTGEAEGEKYFELQGAKGMKDLI